MTDVHITNIQILSDVASVPAICSSHNSGQTNLNNYMTIHDKSALFSVVLSNFIL